MAKHDYILSTLRSEQHIIMIPTGFTIYDGRDDAGGCGGGVAVTFSDGRNEIRINMFPSMVTDLLAELSGLFVKETSMEDYHYEDPNTC